MMRQMGLSVILGGMDGAGGAQVSGLLGLSFSRDAEHQADLASINTLRRANISPLSTAEFFDRMTSAPASQNKSGKERQNAEKSEPPSSIQKIEETTSWLASHPTSKSRHDLFVKAAKKDHAYAPALTAQQWQALRDICRKDRNVKKGFGLGL
jgi:predicted Zn-dependent protease